MYERLARIAARQDGLFTTEEALEAGLTRRTLSYRVQERRDIVRIFNGVYRFAGTPETTRVRTRAVSLAYPDATLCGATAAWLLGLDGWKEPKIIEVAHHSPRLLRDWLSLSDISLLPKHRMLRRGLWFTSGPRTLFDLAAFATDEDIECAMDDVVRKELGTLAEMICLLDELGGRGRPKTRLLHALLKERIQYGGRVPQSIFETLLLKFFRERGFQRPELQYVARENGDRRFIGFVDFAFHEARLIVEADGRYFHSPLPVQQHDAWRDYMLDLNGWRVMRVSYAELATPDELERRCVFEGVPRRPKGEAGLIFEPPPKDPILRGALRPRRPRRVVRPSRPPPEQKKLAL